MPSTAACCAWPRQGDGEIVDLTEGVRRVVAHAEFDRGVVTVFVTGSTVA